MRIRTSLLRDQMALFLDSPEQIWRVVRGLSLLPLSVTRDALGESLKGRLVICDSVVTSWQGGSILPDDMGSPDIKPIRVTVRPTLDWRKPKVNPGGLAKVDVAQCWSLALRRMRRRRS